MSGTGDIHMIDIQVQATDALARARADGSFKAKVKQDRRYFIWQGSLQTIPLGTEKAPAAFARALRRALPLVNTIRVPFNAFSFNPDGSLDPRFETFLEEAARQRFRLLFVYSDGEAQRYGGRADHPEATSLDIHAALEGEIQDRAVASFDRLLSWLNRHPQIQGALYGLELMNEPAAYKMGYRKAGADGLTDPGSFVTLYARQMVALAQHIAPRFTGAILVGGWGYNGTFSIFADTAMEGTTALEVIRKGGGARLIWSAHLYPGWAGTKHATTAAEVAPKLDAVYKVLGGDNLLITETNLKSNDVYTPFSRSPVITAFAQSAPWFADHGVGLGWFLGVQGGPSAFVGITDKGTADFTNLASYAGGMNYFTVADRGRDGQPAQRLTATLLPGRVVLEKNSPDFLLHHLRYDAVDGLGLAVGGGAEDRLTGLPRADNLLYGGRGNDTLQAQGPHDFAYGQDGNDTVIGWNGNDALFGGRGNDLIISLAGFDTLFGGPGADRFSVGPGSKAVISDFAPQDGDTIDFRGHYASATDVLRHTSVIDLNGDGRRELMIWHGTGGYTVLLGMGERLADFAAALAEFTVPTPLPQIPTAEVITGTPFTPSHPVDPEGPTRAARPIPPTLTLAAGPGKSVTQPDTGGTLAGTDSADTLTGGRGDDTIVSGDGDDIVRERHGHNLIFLGNGNDSVRAGRLSGTVVAGAGDDTIALDVRHQGHDIWLGSGTDTVQVLTVQRNTATRVFGFDPARDRIEWQNKPVDLTAPATGIAVAPFARGTAVTFDGVATLFLFPEKTLAAPTLQQQLEAFDPQFASTAPRRHFSD